MGRGAPLAERPDLPALRRRRAHLQDERQEHPARPLQVLPVPQALPRDGRNRVRGQPYPAAHLVAGDCAYVVQSRRASAPTSFTAPLGIGLKAAWFLSHRIREAMRDGALAPMGGKGGIVEADETYLWKTAEPKPSRAAAAACPSPRAASPARRDKRAIVSLVERGGSRPFLPCRERRQGDRQHHRRREHRREKRACTPTKAASTAT